MKSFAFAVLVLMPLVSHAVIGPLKLKGKYFPSSGSDDKCDIINSEVMDTEPGMELKGFDCSGKEDGDVMCFCVGEELNGGNVNYKNICGKCGLAVMPITPEFLGRFQFWRFFNIAVERLQMMAEGNGSKTDKMGHGYTDNINLPTISPRQLMHFSRLLGQNVRQSPGLTSEEKVMVIGKMMEALTRYNGIGGKLLAKMKEGLTKSVPIMSQMFSCDFSMDPKSADFMLKISELMSSLVAEVMENPNPAEQS